jgi:DNA ligase-1
MHFHVLDWYIEGSYQCRCEKIAYWLADLKDPHFHFQTPVLCETPEALLEYFLKEESDNGEGICFRDPRLEYPQKRSLDNRSTLREQYLVKLARFVREEAVIVGFEEQMCNCNSDGKDAMGKMKRSKAIGGMRGKGTLGALLCQTHSMDSTNTIRVAWTRDHFQTQTIW